MLKFKNYIRETFDKFNTRMLHKHIVPETHKAYSDGKYQVHTGISPKTGGRVVNISFKGE